MNLLMKSGEKRLLASFALLILITVCIGAAAIVEIQSLSRRMNRLATHNLALEKAVLEMRVNNALYAAGIRNYVYWKVSRYLGAAPSAGPGAVAEAAAGFRRHLKAYSRNVSNSRQAAWSREIKVSFDELDGLGRRIIDLVDEKDSGVQGPAVKDLIMVFENRLYKLENFLDKTVRLDNLSEIEQELALAEIDRQRSLVSLVVSLAGAVLISWLIALSVLRRRMQERVYREKLFNRMVNLEENERKNLSAEIHDQMGQELSVLKISLGLVEQKMGPQPAEVTEWFAKAKEAAAKLLKKSHNIAYLLRPPSLDDIGLIESIDELLLEYSRLTGVKYEFEKPREGIILPPEHDLLFYRLSQELLTNMAKYSQAKNVKIGFRKDSGKLEFYYEDDGKGFNYDMASNSPRRRKDDNSGMGLVGLKERVELMDGMMRVETAPGKGMKVTVTIGA